MPDTLSQDDHQPLDTPARIVRRLVAECKEHNAEYKHTTPEDVLAAAETLVKGLETSVQYRARISQRRVGTGDGDGYLDLDTPFAADVYLAADILGRPDAPVRLLSQVELRKVGALTVANETSKNVSEFMAQQRATYANASRETLAEELLRRDRNALNEGRQLTDGRMSTVLLRELVRHLLHTADKAALGQLTRDVGKDDPIERILQVLGAPAADRRLLRESGTTLGGGRTTDDIAAEYDALADGKLSHSVTAPQVRADVADSIWEKRKEQVPEVVVPAKREGESDK